MTSLPKRWFIVQRPNGNGTVSAAGTSIPLIENGKGRNGSGRGNTNNPGEQVMTTKRKAKTSGASVRPDPVDMGALQQSLSNARRAEKSANAKATAALLSHDRSREALKKAEELFSSAARTVQNGGK